MGIQTSPPTDWQGAASLRRHALSKIGDYQELKKAILVQYDINEETYCQRFKTAKLRNTETSVGKKITGHCRQMDEGVQNCSRGGRYDSQGAAAQHPAGRYPSLGPGIPTCNKHRGQLMEPRLLKTVFHTDACDLGVGDV